MKVIKRNGDAEAVSFDKISARLRMLTQNKLCGVDIGRLTSLVIPSMHDGISTSKIDDLSADIAITLASEHPDYGTLASRIMVSNWHKETSESILETFESMQQALDPAFLERVRVHATELQSMIDYKRDYDFDFFGLSTFQAIYCTKINGKLIERPQHVYLRTALALCGGGDDGDIKRVKETYNAMSRKKFTHASPTLFNSGMRISQLASCYLMGTEDSLNSIFRAFGDVAQISKLGGGIGLHVHAVRAKGALIQSTNGHSDGIIPMLRCANAIISYVNQSGRRKGSMAIYLQPDHADVMSFLELRRPGGDEETRCRDLFLAMWVPDLFMRRVEAGENWSLFCPGKCPGLSDVYGEEYDCLYEKYESEGKASRTLPAREVFNAILRSQIETGTPYMLYKDSCNAKSNQKNLGTIKCSNLCAEIVEFTGGDNNGEIAVCNLASISLPSFVKNGASFDFKELHSTVKLVARNLDTVIDCNNYPVETAKSSNFLHRPVGIGVQGLADTYILMKYPFDSEEAARLNVQIFAVMYHAALEASTELAKLHGPYETFQGSPASRGQLQYDLWGVEPDVSTGILDWGALKAKIKRHGLRNSLSIACMPTASTAQLFGNVESIEPPTSFLYTRRTLAGEFVVINKYLQRDLLELGLWTSQLKDLIVTNHGISEIHAIPEDLRKLYKTAYELSQRVIIDQAAGRAPYVCQSQSMNLFMADVSFAKLGSAHFYAWKRGLKTGMYYLRTRPVAKAKAITMGSKEEEESCVMCSS